MHTFINMIFPLSFLRIIGLLLFKWCICYSDWSTLMKRTSWEISLRLVINSKNNPLHGQNGPVSKSFLNKVAGGASHLIKKIIWYRSILSAWEWLISFFIISKRSPCRFIASQLERMKERILSLEMQNPNIKSSPVRTLL